MCNKHRCTCHPNAYDGYGRLQPHAGMLYCIPVGRRGAHLGRYAFVDAKGKWHYTQHPLSRSQIRRRNASANQPRSRPHFARQSCVVEVDIPPHSLPRSASSTRRRPPVAPPPPQYPRSPTVNHVGTDRRALQVMHSMHLALYRSRCEEYDRRCVTYEQEHAQWRRDTEKCRLEQAAATKLQALWRGWHVSSRLYPGTLNRARHIIQLRRSRIHVRIQGCLLMARRNQAALVIQRIYRGSRDRRGVGRRRWNQLTCSVINWFVSLRRDGAVTIQSSVRRWLMQRHWKASYAHRLATKKLCRATNEHSKMIQGRRYDISPILEVSKPWPSVGKTTQPRTMPPQYVPPSSQTEPEGKRGGLHRVIDSSSQTKLLTTNTSLTSSYQSLYGAAAATADRAYLHSHFQRRRDKTLIELHALQLQQHVTHGLRNYIRLPYGEIIPEQIYSIADPNYLKDWKRYDGIHYHPSI